MHNHECLKPGKTSRVSVLFLFLPKTGFPPHDHRLQKNVQSSSGKCTTCHVYQHQILCHPLFLQSLTEKCFLISCWESTDLLIQIYSVQMISQIYSLTSFHFESIILFLFHLFIYIFASYFISNQFAFTVFLLTLPTKRNLEGSLYIAIWRPRDYILSQNKKGFKLKLSRSIWTNYPKVRYFTVILCLHFFYLFSSISTY